MVHLVSVLCMSDFFSEGALGYVSGTIMEGHPKPRARIFLYQKYNDEFLAID